MTPGTDWLAYDADEIVKADKNYLWHHMKPHKLFEDQEQMIIVEGQGLVVKDIRGRAYLDASSGGVWSVVVGYGRTSIADAVCAQLKKMPYFAGVVGNVPAIQFAQKLIELLPRHGKVYYSNSGSEANEKAFKIIRQASRINSAFKGKYKILYRDRDYHGTTLGALSATGQEERKHDFGPLCDGFAAFPHALCYRCAFDQTYPGCNLECAHALEDAILKQGPDSVGGVIVEPITAGGGIIVPVPEYYPVLESICKKYGVLMIMDEVVCGFGRTGKFWGHDHYDVDPDMVTLAKGLTSSYEALSATVVKDHVYELFLNDPANSDERLNYFRDISTYGGCTSGMTAALESTRIIEQENLVANSQAMGAYLLDSLKDLGDMPLVGDIRGRGLFCGIEFVQDRQSKTPISEKTMAQIIANVNAEGVLVGRTNTSLPGNNTIMNLAPALIVSREQIDKIVAAIKAAIAKMD